MADEKNVVESYCGCDSVELGDDPELGCENFEMEHLR